MLLALLPDTLRRLAEILSLDLGELLRKLIQIAFVWILAFGAWWVVRLISRRILQAVDDGDDDTLTEREQRGQTLSQLLKSLGRVLIFAVALLLSLNIFINIGPLLAGAGILGLAISFGAQSLVKDIITGFFFLLEAQFAVGDVIEVAGKSGVVERMTLRVVMLRDVHGSVHIIPNGQVVTVTNMTRKWSQAVVDVGVAYGTDVDKALEIFTDEAHAFSRERTWRQRFDGEPEVVGINSLDESQVTIRTLLRTVAGQQWAVGREFRRRILTRLAREGIEIPFPQRSVSLKFEDAATIAKKAKPAKAAKAAAASAERTAVEKDAPVPPTSSTE
jgi:small conductance mechanosensitive channel